MVPYLVTFTLSILLCAGGEWELRRNRYAGALLCGGAVALPVILAGARDYSVGTDIATYGNYVFQAAYNARNPFSYLRTQKEIELLYKALAFVVTRFTDNPHWFYFVTALIICGLTMCGLWYYRRWCSITLAWACFLFLFYGDTLNTMRQCLALAVLFAAFPLFLEKKYLRFALLCIVAVLFHVTGIIGLILPVVYLYMKKVPPRWLQFFLIIVCMGVILFYSPLLRIVLSMNLLPAKFSRYLAKGVAVAINPTILRLPFLIPIIMYYDRFCSFREIPAGPVKAAGARVKRAESGAERAEGTAPGSSLSGDTAEYAEYAEEETYEDGGEAFLDNYMDNHMDPRIMGMFVVIMLLVEICTVQLRSVRPALYRISYYFGYYRFIAYSRLVRILRRDNRILVAAVLIAYLLVLWYYQNVIQGNNQIYPYVYAPRWFYRIIPVMPAD